VSRLQADGKQLTMATTSRRPPAGARAFSA